MKSIQGKSPDFAILECLMMSYFNVNNIHPPVAKQILAVMIRGLFFKLEFSFTHFPTEGITADLMFPLVWEGIRIVESTGLKVIAVTADGAAQIRKFFRMHG